MHHCDGALFGMNISKLVSSVYGGAITIKYNAIVAEKISSLQDAVGRQRSLWNNLVARLYVIVAAFTFNRYLYNLVLWSGKHIFFIRKEINYYEPSKISLPTDCLDTMSAFEASIGEVSFDKLKGRIEARRKIAAVYDSALHSYDSLVVIPLNDTYSHYPIILKVPGLRDSIKRLIESEYSAEVGIIVDYSVAELLCYSNIYHRRLQLRLQ